ncbi:MAG: DDE-type integrase/transposase/recombinase [Kastovskya adunca ATA6-11-RM4]|jgi:transposase InsO family protein|nr:DDE-type integrase/transposase/recombinase [Kastovskya adunca ATA6-11-RM4]
MVQQWIAPLDLVGLPGMPNTRRGVTKKLERECANSRRKRQGRGGGWEYSLDCLPTETQAALNSEHFSIESEHCSASSEHYENPPVVVAPQPIQTETFIEDSDTQIPAGEKAQKRIDAWVYVLREWENFCNNEGLKKIECQFEFCRRYKAGKLDIPSDVREILPKNLSRMTLERKRQQLEKEGVNRLAGKHGHRKGRSKVDERFAVRDVITAMLIDFPHASTQDVFLALEGRFEREILPSLRTIQRWVASWREENENLLLATSNPDAWKSKRMVAFGRYSENIKYPNQLWELDSTPADILLEDGRYNIVGLIDVYTRRAMLLVSRTSKASAIAALLRRALLEWGVPEVVKTDNGKDYTSRHLLRVLAGLDIKQKLCQPFHPWQKPHIERFFKTFSHDILKLLPGYVGHNVTERRELEARHSFADRLFQKDKTLELRISNIEFQQFCDRWCDDDYQHRSHEGLQEQTPFQVLTNSRASIRTIVDERALDILLAEAPGGNGMRRVQKRGIQLEGAWFISPELEAFIGQSVQVRFDPHDLGRLYIFGGSDLRFICVAECPERTGISRKEVAIAARTLQKQRISAGRKALKAIAKRANTGEIVEQILSHREEAANQLAAFPAPSEEHSSKGLRAAQEAVEALREPTLPQPPSEEELERELAALEAIEKTATPKFQIRDSEYWYALWSEIEAGQIIPASEVTWMKYWLTETAAGEGIQLYLKPLRLQQILERLQEAVVAIDGDKQLAV